MENAKPHPESCLAPAGEPWFQGDLGPRHLEGILGRAGLTSFELVCQLTQNDMDCLGIQAGDRSILSNNLNNWLERRQRQAEEVAIFVAEQNLQLA